MPHRFLLEIGTEELPAGFQASAREELKAVVAQQMTDWGADNVSVTVWTTPRRITLQVDNIPTRQADRSVRLQGPSISAAKDAQGGWTAAAQGFARKNQASVDSLTIEDNYVVLHRQQPGLPFNQLVAEHAGNWILGLSGSHFMQWGNSTASSDRFSRPIRWVLSLWDDALLPLSVAGVAASTISVGHRLLGRPDVSIPSIDAYESNLHAQGVIVNPTERRRRIAAQLEAAAQQLGGALVSDDDLLDTITDLVESPSVVTGQFDTQFLTVPDIVLMTVMKHHQKYAAVTDAQGRLKPVFLAVSNARPEAADTIAAGNERVLTARFHDAAFFYQDDLKQPLSQRVASLNGLTFQKGLGTLKQKTDRLVALCEPLGQALGLTVAEIADAQRAALLCKTDLTTGMVRELTELQGEMGAIYAQETGEPPGVSVAIGEHYLPRFSGDRLPQSPAGIVVSLADKLDTLVAVFTQPGAKLPSGSKDPMGLRRLANGIWQILWDYPKSVDLYPLMATLEGSLEPFSPRPWTEALPLLKTFLTQRLDTLLLEKQLRSDWVQAVQPICDPIANLAGFRARLGQLAVLANQPTLWTAIVQPATRIARILPERQFDTVLMPAIPAELDIEARLQQALLSLPTDTTALLHALPTLQPVVNDLFDHRMINDPDPAIRAIRLQLLQAADALYCRFADFSRLPDVLA